MWEGQVHETLRHSVNNHVYNGMTVVLRMKLQVNKTMSSITYIPVSLLCGAKVCTLLYMQLRTNYPSLLSSTGHRKEGTRQ